MIKIQKESCIEGVTFEMNLGCSSAAAALHVAFNLVRSGGKRRVLIVTLGIVAWHLNFRDRQTHSIFGDASVAMAVEVLGPKETRPVRFEILDMRNWIQFSNNIRANFGFLMHADQETSFVEMEGDMIKKVGNNVFKEVTHAVHRLIAAFLADHDMKPSDILRYWLQQANTLMNVIIL